VANRRRRLADRCAVNDSLRWLESRGMRETCLLNGLKRSGMQKILKMYTLKRSLT